MAVPLMTSAWSEPKAYSMSEYVVALVVLAVVGHVVERDRLTALDRAVGAPRVPHGVDAGVAVVVVRLARVDARDEQVVAETAVERARYRQRHVRAVGVLERVLAVAAVHHDRHVCGDDLDVVVAVAEVDLDAVDATEAIGCVAADRVGPDRVAGRRIGVPIRVARDVDGRRYAVCGLELGNLPLRPALDPKVVDLAVRRVEVQHLLGPVVCDVGGRRARRRSEHPKGERGDCTNEPSMASCLHRAKVGQLA